MTSTSNYFRAAAALSDALSVFPKGQNASSTVITRLVDTLTWITPHINVELLNGLRNIENQFNPTPICRNRPNQELSNLITDHQCLCTTFKAAHQKMYIELQDGIALLEKTRRALVNAKRVRNTQNNEMRALLRHLRNDATKREAILCLLNRENVSDKFKPRASPEQIRMLEQMIDQVKHNYRNTSTLLTQQIRWNYTVILSLLTQFQEHSKSAAAKVKEHVAECRKREQQLISCALHEFSFEHAWRSLGDNVNVQVVQFDEDSHWCSIENSTTGELTSSIVNFTPETHCNPEIISAFHAAQAEAAAAFAEIQANSWVASEFFDDNTTEQMPAYNDAEFVEEVWETDLFFDAADAAADAADAYDDNELIESLAAFNEAEFESLCDKRDDDVAEEADEDDAGAGDYTPKATLKTSCGSSHKRDGCKVSFTSIAAAYTTQKPKKSIKKTFEPLRINENTNRTTGTLREEECVSKKDYDAQRKHICDESIKTARSSKSSGGALGGRRTKNEFERWNKKKAAAKMMSRMMSSSE